MQKSRIFTYLYNTIIVLLLLAGIPYVVLQFTHFGHIEYTDNARVCEPASRKYHTGLFMASKCWLVCVKKQKIPLTLAHVGFFL